MTQAKKSELEIELIERKSVIRPTILDKLKAARELGDLKENAEYHVTRDEQGRNESRIREIEELLKFSRVVEKSDNGTIDLASHFSVKKVGADEEKEFLLVGPAEADFANGKIASTSPLGRAVIGKSVGNIIEVMSPKGEIKYEITNVE